MLCPAARDFRRRLDAGVDEAYRLFPVLHRRRAPARGHAVGRRAADARHRPRADEPAAAAPVRRAVARPGAPRRAGDHAAPRGAPRGGHDHSPRRAERAHGAARRGPRPTCSRRAAWCWRARRRTCSTTTNSRPPTSAGRRSRKGIDGMSETSDELLRGFQAQEKRFVERRFPLRFAPESPALRELYAQAKGLRWNPETDIAWSRFDPAAYAQPVREAARLVWSRRAWGTYPGLGENTALLIRFCLESGAARHGRQALPVLPPRRGGQAARGVLPLRQAAGRLRVRRRARPSRGRATSPSPRWRSIPTCRWRRWWPRSAPSTTSST